MGRDSINEIFDSLLIVLSSLIRLLIALLAIAFASPLVTVIVILSLIPLIFFNSNINKKIDTKSFELHKFYSSQRDFRFLGPSPNTIY